MPPYLRASLPFVGSSPRPPTSPSFTRLAFYILSPLLLLLLLWSAWYYEASRRFNREIDSLVSMGRPLLPDEFNRPAIPRETNAVPRLLQAERALSRTTRAPSNTGDRPPDHFPFPDSWHQAVAAAISANSRSLDLIRQARLHTSDAHWNIVFQSPVLDNLSEAGFEFPRELAHLLGDAALYSCLNGDFDAALDFVDDLLFVASAIEQDETYGAFMVNITVVSIALVNLQLIAAALEQPPQPPDSLDRPRVQALIHRLLDEDTASRNLRNAVAVERMLIVDYIRTEARRSLALRPMLLIDGVRCLRLLEQIEQAAGQSLWPAASAMIPPPPRNTRRIPRASRAQSTRVWSDGLLPLTRAPRFALHLSTERRLTAIALACRLYHLDNGRYPESLEDLVPELLPSLPVDPFDPDGRPLKYLLAADNRPIVYSVGDDGVDQTGESALPDRPNYGWHDPGIDAAGNTLDDQWRDISPRRRP